MTAGAIVASRAGYREQRASCREQRARAGTRPARVIQLAPSHRRRDRPVHLLLVDQPSSTLFCTMSDTMFSAAATTATVLVPSAAVESVATADPPIVEIARFLYSSSVYTVDVFIRLLSTLGRVSLSLTQTFAAPFGPISLALLYLFSPVVVFFQILLDAFIFAPYSVAVTILQNLYPVYVFVGVSVLFAATVGLGARGLVSASRHLLFTPSSAPSHARSKPAKRVSIKEEK